MVIHLPNISNYKLPSGNKIWLCSIFWLMVLAIFCRKRSLSSFLFYYHWIGHGVLDIWSWNDSRLCLCVSYLGSSQNYVWCQTCHVFIKGISYFKIWLALQSPKIYVRIWKDIYLLIVHLEVSSRCYKVSNRRNCKVSWYRIPFRISTRLFSYWIHRKARVRWPRNPLWLDNTSLCLVFKVLRNGVLFVRTFIIYLWINYWWPIIIVLYITYIGWLVLLWMPTMEIDWQEVNRKYNSFTYGCIIQLHVTQYCSAISSFHNI